MLSKKQIAIIHTAKSKLKLSDESYRDLLSGFGVSSSTELSYPQFIALMDAFKKLGFTNAKREYRTINRNESRDTGTVKIATGPQQRYITALWMQSAAVKEKNHDALRRFVKRIAGVDRLDWLHASKVQKVVKAIQSLKPEVVEC